MNYASPVIRDKFAARHPEPKGSMYVLRKVAGERYCPGCKILNRPWAGTIKRAGWNCGCRA